MCIRDSSITGFNAIEESDMIAMPDPATFAVLPWRPEEQGVGRMFCDVLTPERTPVSYTHLAVPTRRTAWT